MNYEEPRGWECRIDGHYMRYFYPIEDEPAFEECEECGEVIYAQCD